MKYVFVGDIHGKVECVQEALDRDGFKVFVGDIMDSYDRPPKDHKECLELVLGACIREEAVCLYGNHELSYTHARPCSGYKWEHMEIVQEYKNLIHKHFKHYFSPCENFLVTHAGLTKQLWEDHYLGGLEEWGDVLLILDKWSADKSSPAWYVGNCRGGWMPYGGIYWCDFDREFQPIPDVTQVFGHTRAKKGEGIRQIENSFCIDCLDENMQFLEIEL